MGVSFHGFSGPEIAQEVHLGSSYQYVVAETKIRIAAPDGHDAELALLAASADSLRTTALIRIDDAERTAAQNRADDDLGRLRATVDANAPEFHRLLGEFVPLDRCW